MPSEAPANAATALSPAISVVLVTPDDWSTIQRTAACLHSQTVRDQIELLIVAPAEHVIDRSVAELDGFWAVRVVPGGAIPSVAIGNTYGALAATADIVAFVEEHAFPDPDWAQALIQAHRMPCAAVAPAARNAVPDSVVGWADHLVSYGPWMDPSRSGPRDGLCWHNVSYKRSVLLACGDDLEAMLAAETNLHWQLRARDETLWLAGEARIAHLGFTHLRGALGEALHNGRSLATARSTRWSPLRRLVYAVGSPLIPAVRMVRLLRQLRANPAQRRGVPAAAWPAVILILYAGAVGEFFGYAFGPGSSATAAARYEFHRQRQNRPEHRP